MVSPAKILSLVGITLPTYLPCAGRKPGTLVCSPDLRSVGICPQVGDAIAQPLAVGDNRCGVLPNSKRSGEGGEEENVDEVFVKEG